MILVCIWCLGPGQTEVGVSGITMRKLLYCLLVWHGCQEFTGDLQKMSRLDFQKMLCSCELFAPLAEQVGEHFSAIGIQSSKRIVASSIVQASFRRFDSICLQRFRPVLQSSTMRLICRKRPLRRKFSPCEEKLWVLKSEKPHI